jgi:hypothetical protein
MFDDEDVGSVPETSTADVEEVQTDQPETDDQASESVSEDADDQPEEASNDDDESEQDDEQPEAGSDPDTVKVEYDGEEYEVPKRLKDAVMATKDYTEKTQALGDERRSYEAEKADFTQYMEATKAQSDQLANLAAMDQQLQSFQAYDWNAAFDADITSATKLQHQMQQLQSNREQLVQTIQQGETQRQGVQHENMVRTAERTDARLAQEVTGWGEEMKSELGKFAVDMGFPADAVSNAVTYPEINVLRLAQIGWKTEQQVKSAVKSKDRKVVAVKPSKNLKPKRQSAPKTLSNVSDPGAYRELRLAQKRKQAKG